MAQICSGNRCVEIPDQVLPQNINTQQQMAMNQYGHLPGFQPLPANYQVRPGQGRPAGLINGKPVYASGTPAPTPPAGHVGPYTDPRGHSLEEAMDINHQGDVRNAARYLQHGQELTPAMEYLRPEAMAQLNPQQPQTVAQMVQGFDKAPSFDPIEQLYKNKFYSETVPALAERFVGSKSGSSFKGALGSAGAQLNTNLAALRSDFDMALRDQMIRMAQINQRNQLLNQQTPEQPTWLDRGAQAAQVAAELAGYGNIAALGGELYRGARNYFRGTPSGASAQPNLQSYYGDREVNPQAIQYYGKQITSPFKTPEDVQKFQAATGLGGSAAADFANTFRQPGSQADMMNRNVNKFKRFLGAGPASAFGELTR